jgi:hypothetical protein
MASESTNAATTNGISQNGMNHNGGTDSDELHVLIIGAGTLCYPPLLPSIAIRRSVVQPPMGPN